jgi:hypothetical protein
MGVFIKNKNKRVANNDQPIELSNLTQDIALIGDENKVFGKKSLRGGIKPIDTPNIKKLEPVVTPNIKKLEPVVTPNIKKLEPVVTPPINVTKEPIKKIEPAEKIDLIFMSLNDFKDFIKNKTIILVANSSDLLKRENGWFVDNHDIIIRFNSFLIDEKHTGVDTTIHVAFELMDSCFEYYVPVRIITSTTEKLSKLDKYNQSYVLNWDHDCYDNNFTLNEKNYFEKNGKIPTTGFTILRLLLKLGGYYKINLFGFTFYEGGNDSIFRSAKGISNAHDYEYESKCIMDSCYYFDQINNIITFYDKK